MSILREKSYDSRDAKDALMFEDSVLSKEATPDRNLDQEHSVSVGHQSALRNASRTPDSGKGNMLSYEQIRDQIENKKERLIKMQNSFIHKNKRLVSQTKRKALRDLAGAQMNYNQMYATNMAKSREKGRSMPVSTR